MIRTGFTQKDDAPGRIALRAFALLFALMALSNTLKVFAYTEATGFVLLGQRLSGMPNTVVTLAIAMGTFYALYVVANLTLWNFCKPEGADASLLFAIPYLISAIGVSSGAALLLRRHRERYD